jgi:hypothetical protein
MRDIQKRTDGRNRHYPAFRRGLHFGRQQKTRFLMGENGFPDCTWCAERHRMPYKELDELQRFLTSMVPEASSFIPNINWKV